MNAQVIHHLVLGAGLTGLGRALLLAQGGRDVAVLEATDRVGGSIQTIDDGGFRVEGGAVALAGDAPHLQALLSRLPEAPALSTTGPIWTWTRHGLEPPSFGAAGPGTPPYCRVVLGGTGALITALDRALIDRVHLGVQADTLEAADEGGGYVIYTTDGAAWRAKEVTLAVPAPEQARLLADLHPNQAEALGAIPHAPAIRIAAAVAATPPGLAAAFTRGPGAPGRIGPVVLTSRLDPGRAPEGYTLVQAMLTGKDVADLEAWTDSTLEQVVAADLQQAFGAPLPIARLWLSRQAAAWPQTTRGHRTRMARIQALLGDRGLYVLGDHVTGTGLERRCVPAAPTRAPVPDGVTLL